MTRYIRHAAAFCLLLLIALLVNATRVQVVNAAVVQREPGQPAARRSPATTSRAATSRRRPPGSPARATPAAQLAWVRTYTRRAAVRAGDRVRLADLRHHAAGERRRPGAVRHRPATWPRLPLWNEITRQPAPGGQVHSTIDPAAQRAAYQGLAGRRGAVAAMDPATGRILALVSSPSYDPALLSPVPGRPSAAPGSG